VDFRGFCLLLRKCQVLTNAAPYDNIKIYLSNFLKYDPS